MEHANKIVADRSYQDRQTKEQSQAVEQDKREKKELTQQPKSSPAAAEKNMRFWYLKVMLVSSLIGRISENIRKVYHFD